MAQLVKCSSGEHQHLGVEVHALESLSWRRGGPGLPGEARILVKDCLEI